MLNFKDGKFQAYNGDNTKPFMTNINGQWIRFKVVFRGPQKKIDVYYGDSLENKETYPQNGQAKDFHFKFGPYGKEDRNNKHTKMEAWFKYVSMTKNGKNFSVVFAEWDLYRKFQEPPSWTYPSNAKEKPFLAREFFT